MYLTVGEISKVLGISTEMIRFYVREGIIKPKQNKDNNYWEYSSEDVMYLSDILFYRDMDLPLKDIKHIFDGLSLEEISEMIRLRKEDAALALERCKQTLEKLEDWESCLHDEMNMVGRYKVGNMPVELRKEAFYNEADHIADYLGRNVNIEKTHWRYASISFYYNLYDEKPEMKKYFSLNKTEVTERLRGLDDIVEEEAEKCIFTQVHFSEQAELMTAGLADYARIHDFQLTGEIYGRENTNYYQSGKRLGLYRLYAPIK